VRFGNRKRRKAVTSARKKKKGEAHGRDLHFTGGVVAPCSVSDMRKEKKIPCGRQLSAVRGEETSLASLPRRTKKKEGGERRKLEMGCSSPGRVSERRKGIIVKVQIAGEKSSMRRSSWRRGGGGKNKGIVLSVVLEGKKEKKKKEFRGSSSRIIWRGGEGKWRSLLSPPESCAGGGREKRKKELQRLPSLLFVRKGKKKVKRIRTRLNCWKGKKKRERKENWFPLIFERSTPEKKEVGGFLTERVQEKGEREKKKGGP